MSLPSHHAVARWLALQALRLYPRAWRMRYTEEMGALLDEHPATLWTVIDILVGAFDAHVHRHLLPGEVLTMAQQIRTGVTALFGAFSLFIVAWLMVPFISDTPAVWDAATAQHREIAVALALFMGMGGFALVAVVVGGLPLVVATAQGAMRQRRRDVLWRLAMPLGLGAVLVAFSLVAQPRWWQRWGLSLPDSALWVKAAFFVVAFLMLGASTWALTSAITRSYLSDRLLRFTRVPALLVGLALWGGLAALVALTILVFAEAPQLADPGFALPGFDALLLCVCGIASAALHRMTQAFAQP